MNGATKDNVEEDGKTQNECMDSDKPNHEYSFAIYWEVVLKVWKQFPFGISDRLKECTYLWLVIFSHYNNVQ